MSSDPDSTPKAGNKRADFFQPAKRKKNTRLSPNMVSPNASLDDIANAVESKISMMLDRKLENLATKADLKKLSTNIERKGRK